MTLLAALAALIVFSAQDPANYRVYAGAESRTLDQMLDDLAKADVVVIGENHDHKLGHVLELAIFKGVNARKLKTALSLEMFERDVQPILDEYLAGHITESHFLQSSRPWPTYKTDYAPMVEHARTSKLPVIAANAPRRYVNIVSRKGQSALADLPHAAKQNIAPLPFSMELPLGYDRMLTDLFSANHGAASQRADDPTTQRPAMPPVENMKQSQALWDATMADSIHRFLRKNRGWTVVQVNGAGHSDHRYGLVDRLQKSNTRLQIRTVTIKPDSSYPSLPTAKYNGIADYLILTPPDPKSP